MRSKVFQILILFFCLSACTDTNTTAGSDALYADYSIAAEEGADKVTCVLKFFTGPNKTTALLLEPPAAVLLDGAPIAPDSAGRNGAYYELQKPLAEFAGRHTIIFKNAEGKTYSETFLFQPFSITTDVGETVTRGDITIQLTGLKNGEPVRVLLTDTSFATPDINDIDTIKAGMLLITRNALRNVASGPVTLHLYKEEERPLQQAPAAGGRLSITYGLSREFELVDE